MSKRKYLVFQKKTYGYEYGSYDNYDDGTVEVLSPTNYMVELTSEEAKSLETYQYFLLEVLDPGDVRKALDTALLQAKEDALRATERKAKAKAAKDKREANKEAAAVKRDLAKLKALKKKYNE